MENIDILVALDENYLPPLKVMLTSLFFNNHGEKFRIWLMYSHISKEKLDLLDKNLKALNMELHSVKVNEEDFKFDYTVGRYTIEMYYRLLAQHILPKFVKRVIYLDPDVLVINPIRELWELDLNGKFYAAASHTGATGLSDEVNKIRLGTDHKYFNSGVLLIDLNLAKKKTSSKNMFKYVKEHKVELVLPDQDVLNGLYGSHIMEIEDAIWNYDARNYNTYYVKSGGEMDTMWVMQNTVILHFCGSAKPWQPKYRYRFGVLYMHYMKKSSYYFD